MPFLNVVVGILNEFKNWLFAIGGVLAVVVNTGRAVKYQAADASEKAEIVRDIRNSLAWIAGIFVIAWLALYIYDKFNGVN